MAYFRDLRELINHLDVRGKLYRIQDPINKDTELMPFYRVQMRGLSDPDRKVFLFENVFGAEGKKYDMPVLAGIYGASEEILALGVGCESYKEALEKWHYGMTHPLPPVLIDGGPVHDEIHVGQELSEIGLDEFPVPVEEPGFSGIIRTGLPMITKDPEDGIRNVGTYNGFFRSRDRIVGGGAATGHLRFHHLKTARSRKESLPVAILIGCNPEVMLVGGARIPYGVDELAVAGGMVGSSIELVRCRTIPLEVPAYAEAVIEGIMSPELLEPKGAYGEYPGYVSLSHDVYPVIKVTAITHRKNTMFTPVLVGFGPSDNNFILSFCRSAQEYHHLKYECNFPVEEVYFPQVCGRDFCLIRLDDKGEVGQETVRNLLQEASKRTQAKYIIALDYDINLRDPELLLWALGFRTQPKEDFTIVQGGFGGLDPSAAPIETRPDTLWGTEGGGSRYSRALINATRKWPYPPVALPRRDYMEKAIQLWQQHADLPKPELRDPWYGYTLGYWTEDFQEDADLIAQGKYLQVGKKYVKLEETVTEEKHPTVKVGRG